MSAFNASLSALDETARHQRYLSLAQAALRHYDVQNPQPVFVQHNAGITYRVEVPQSGEQFLLKLHIPAGLATRVPLPDEIEARLQWLAAVDQHTDLVVQAPIANTSGRLLTRMIDPDLPELFCSLQRWIEGDPPQGDFSEQQIGAIGRMMGTFHTVGSISPELRIDALPQFDVTGIAEWVSDLQTAVSLGLLTTADGAVVTTAGSQLQQLFGQWAETRDTWGPIHGDLHHANLLFVNDEPRPIDFDSLQYAPYVLDLGTILYHIHYQGAIAQRVLLAGYRNARPSSRITGVELDMALLYGVMGNLAFQVTLPEQWPTALLARNLRQLIDEFCIPFLVGESIVAT